MGYNPLPPTASLATQLSTIKLTKPQETLLRSHRTLSTNLAVASAGIQALKLRKHRLEQEKQQEKEDWLKEFRARQKTLLARQKTVRRMGSVKRSGSVKGGRNIGGSGHGGTATPNFSRKGEVKPGQAGASASASGLQRKINIGRLMRTESIRHAKSGAAVMVR